MAVTPTRGIGSTRDLSEEIEDYKRELAKREQQIAALETENGFLWSAVKGDVVPLLVYLHDKLLRDLRK